MPASNGVRYNHGGKEEVLLRGSERVIAELNRALQAELQAIVQYIVHAEMQNNQGYYKLGGYIKKQAIGEMHHFEGLIERILYLEGTPNVSSMPPTNIGANVRQQLENDRQAERESIAMYNAAAKICMDEGDNGSRDLFVSMVKDEEDHEDWLDAQLQVIQDVGIQNYLAQQSGGAGEG
jgi:bacterioferritin